MRDNREVKLNYETINKRINKRDKQFCANVRIYIYIYKRINYTKKNILFYILYYLIILLLITYY